MPPLEPGDIALVRESFRAANSAPEILAAAFFRRLFELDRSLRRKIKGDLPTIGQECLSGLHQAIESLEKLDLLRPGLHALGARYAGLGWRDEQFAVIGIAIIGALAAQLGKGFTADAHGAWTRVLGTMMDEVVAGARSPAQPHNRVSP